MKYISFTTSFLCYSAAFALLVYWLAGKGSSTDALWAIVFFLLGRINLFLYAMLNDMGGIK